jgi:hypothetical protein
MNSSTSWISNRPPVRADADRYGYVLLWNRTLQCAYAVHYSEVSVYHNSDGAPFTFAPWMPMPKEPE